ncbi:unnamed protein product [Prunus armeniaca]
MTFNHGQLISLKSSTLSVVSNANGTPSPVVGEGSLSLSTSLHMDSVLLVPSLDHNLLSIAQLTTTLGTSSWERRLVVVLGGANSTTWTRHRIVRPKLVKLSQLVELVLRGRVTKFGYGINLLGMPRSVILRSCFHHYFPVLMFPASNMIRVNWLKAIVSRSH